MHEVTSQYAWMSADRGIIGGDIQAKWKNMMKQRILGYDLAKAGAMFMVVLLHYAYYTNDYPSDRLTNAIATFCMICVPLFFTVNGALLLPRPLDARKHYRKLAVIVAVIVVWKTIDAAFCVLVDRSYEVGFKDYLKFLLGGNFGDYPTTGYFWFMNALIAVYLVYPLVKLIFDENGVALRACLVVLLVFGFGKDSAITVLDMLGVLTHHDLSSLLDDVGKFYIFGGYGYILLYFIAGGLIARRIKDVRDKDHPWPFRTQTCLLFIVVGFCCLFGVQRFQAATSGVNLNVARGYWLLPTLVETLLVLVVCLRVNTGNSLARSVITSIGSNTFGVYMLHLMAIVMFAKLQELPVMAWMGHVGSYASVLVNIGCALILFLGCTAVSVVLRRVPGVRLLLSV